ncbi:unnamed protein product [Lasius platythorax]|uniref:Uncharacterized protein n=1 Tax=Lasius platythorax TaxID=488582 RepID=A0AAV2NE46_9HYME
MHGLSTGGLMEASEEVTTGGPVSLINEVRARRYLSTDASNLSTPVLKVAATYPREIQFIPIFSVPSLITAITIPLASTLCFLTLTHANTIYSPLFCVES